MAYGKCQEEDEKEEEEEEEEKMASTPQTSTSKDLGFFPPAFSEVRVAQQMPRGLQHAARGSTLTRTRDVKTTRVGDLDHVRAPPGAIATKPSKRKRAKPHPDKTPRRRAQSARSDAARGEPLVPADQTAGCSLTADLRVKDAGGMSSEERAQLRRAVGGARATVLTMVYQDGSTQLDPEQVSEGLGCHEEPSAGVASFRGHASSGRRASIPIWSPAATRWYQWLTFD